MPWTEIALLCTISFFTSAMTAVIGVGGGVVMIATLLMFLPPAAAIPFQGMVQMVGAGSRVVILRKSIAWPIVWRIGLLMPLGAAVGLWLFQGFSQRTIELLIGSFVLISLFSGKLKFTEGRDLPLWGFFPLGFLIGALSVTVAVVAMFSGPFMIRRDMNKAAINVTMATVAVLGHVIKVTAFGIIGFRPQDYLAPFLAIVPAVIFGTLFGKRILDKLSEAFFLWIFRVSLGGLALKLVLWDGLIGPYLRS